MNQVSESDSVKPVQAKIHLDDYSSDESAIYVPVNNNDLDSSFEEGSRM